MPGAKDDAGSTLTKNGFHLVAGDTGENPVVAQSRLPFRLDRLKGVVETDMQPQLLREIGEALAVLVQDSATRRAGAWPETRRRCGTNQKNGPACRTSLSPPKKG